MSVVSAIPSRRALRRTPPNKTFVSRKEKEKEKKELDSDERRKEKKRKKKTPR